MKEKYRILTVLFIALSFTLSFAQPSGGDGSSGTPWLISNYADLVWLQTASSEWGSGKYFLQTADIDASATAVDGWNPLGSQAFAAEYDGGGFAIDGLTMNDAGELGFIEECVGGTVKNLGLTNVAITKNGNDYAGALIAYMAGGTVDNCYSTGSITSTAVGNYYGGLIGRARDNGAISNSYSEVNMSGLLPSSIGGFIGLITSGATVTNCYATGNVEGEDNIGGFIGLDEVCAINKCYSTGNTTANDKNAGGFIGYNYKGTVSECYSRGNVSGARVTGGFAGQNYTGVISNCYSFGSVSQSGAYAEAGGFCGRNYESGTIEYCYSTGVNNSSSSKGFIGSSYSGTPVLTDNFFDATTSGCTDGLATGKTTTEMKTQATFTNWDFATIWEIVGGDGANYPRLLNQQDPTLPVELTLFEAVAKDGAVVLTWETATEVNNYGFEVQSSKDKGQSWETIGFIEGAGNSNSPKQYSYVVTNVSNSASYRLKQIDTDSAFEYSDVVTVGVNGLAKAELYQNHPNPFNPTTVISFSIPEASKVSITVFNALGQEVAQLVNKEFSVGNYSVDFNASNLTSGIYFYTLNSANFSKTMKMMLLK